jgi:hypothetical protein
MVKHEVQWVTVSPLWKTLAADPVRMQRPALLRFDSDNFMEDLAARLASKPPDFATVVARPKSFVETPLGASRPPAQPTRLKLYQPVHGHFNLVGASLVCRMAGLPDRAVNTPQHEAVGFVLRRLSADGEKAWVTAPRGAGWTLVPDPKRLADAEEVLPLSPVLLDDNGRRRSLYVGLIPTAARDTFQSAAEFPPADDARLTAERSILDPRIEEIEARVLGPLDALKTLKYTPDPAATTGQAQQAAQQQPLQQQEISRFILLDLADFLNVQLPTVWSALVAASSSGLSFAEGQLYNLLATTDATPSTKWSGALQHALRERDRILQVVPDQTTVNYNLTNTALTVDALRDRLRLVLSQTPAPPPAAANLPEVPKLDGNPDTRYVVRCVYQRPHCGPLHPDLLSAPSEDFAIASYYDFEAPARPIRIALPFDASIAGLRKFKKNVAFVLSTQLRKQMSRATKGVLKDEAGSGQDFELGEICSFSIPIITICALFVLIIFLTILNIIFWWLPFLKICLPIPRKP